MVIPVAGGRSTIRRTIKISPVHGRDVSLNLAMLGCEDQPPYGPAESTASLFLELMCSAIVSSSKSHDPTLVESDSAGIDFEVAITIYRATLQDYPANDEEWDSYDGVLLPGSFSSACDKDDWIELLKQVIQVEIHKKGRKALGVCFGHQVYSHSFHGGLAAPCPAGTQAGRRSCIPTKECIAMLKPEDDAIDLLYTHGDMVQSLPMCAVPLFGNEKVQIQAAAYFSTEHEASEYRSGCTSSAQDVHTLPEPYAFTFQAHPEYTSDLGFNRTFRDVALALDKRGDVPSSQIEMARIDANENFGLLERFSVGIIVSVGRTLGWFA